MNFNILIMEKMLKQLPEERQLQIQKCIVDIRELIDHYGEDDAYFAIARIGAEISGD